MSGLIIGSVVTLVITVLGVSIKSNLDEKTVLWKRILFGGSAFLISFITLLALFFCERIRIYLTIYEIVVFVCLVALFLNFYIIPVILRKEFLEKRLLFLTCIICIVIGIFAILTQGQAFIHSDTATALLLAREQIRTHSLFPGSWCYVNGDLWVLSQNLLAIPLTYLIHNQPLVRALVSVLMLIITIWSIWYHSRIQMKDESWMISIPIFLVGLYGNIDMILYQSAYTSALFKMLLCVGWYACIVESKEKKWIRFVFPIFLCIVTTEGIRQIAEIVIPLLGTVIVCSLYEFRDYKKLEHSSLKRLIIQGLYVIVPVLLGLILHKWVSSTHIMWVQENLTAYVGSISQIWTNLGVVVQNTISNFGYIADVSVASVAGMRNLVSIFLCIMVTVIIPILQLLKWKEESFSVQFFMVFSMIHNLALVFIVVFTGKTTDRYLLTVIYTCIIISAHYILKYWLKKDTILSSVISLGLSFCLLLEAFSLTYLNLGWEQRLRDKKIVAEALIEHNLYYGYATYWNAYTNVIYSNFEVQIGGINIDANGISPYGWLVSEEWLNPENDYEETFLLLSGDEERIVKDSSIEDVLGKPYKVFDIDQTNYVVYVYDYNIMQVLNVN